MISVNDKEVMNKFKGLKKNVKQEIRIKYKQAHLGQYRHSIGLFVSYLIWGLIGLIGLYIALTRQVILGFIIYVISFICLVLLVILLKKSNEAFYKYLRRVIKKY